MVKLWDKVAKGPIGCQMSLEPWAFRYLVGNKNCINLIAPCSSGGKWRSIVPGLVMFANHAYGNYATSLVLGRVVITVAPVLCKWISWRGRTASVTQLALVEFLGFGFDDEQVFSLCRAYYYSSR